MNLDPELKPDVLSVLEAAALLDTTEFRVFDIAYLRWFGHQAASGLLERQFAAYMFEELVPHWVQHFTRQVIRAGRAGTLHRSDYGLREPPASRTDTRRGRIYAIVLVLVMVFLIAMTLLDEELVRLMRDCYFPPCY